MRVLTLGETMALLDPHEHGAPASGNTYTLRFAGAESNFAIALARLGVSVAWISRVGADPLGDMIEHGVRAEGVDTRWVARDANARTGLFLKIRTAAGTRPLYYRAGSAASRMTAADVPPEALADARIVHLTGITPALSESARATVLDVAQRARAAGAIVLFDPNYRPALWRDAAEARAAHAALLPYVDWYLAGRDEAEQIWGVHDMAAIEQQVTAHGARNVVLRLGAEGAVVAGEVVPPTRVLDVVDEVGAGDAFAAGFAYGLLHGMAARTAVQVAHLVAGAALLGTGDWETLPRRADIDDMLVSLMTNAECE